jgi:hypothetical protein
MQNAFLWMGIALTTFCLFIFVRDDWRMLSRGRRRARGTVFGHRRSIDEGSEVFAPMVRFQAEDGRQFETTDIVLNATPTPQVGTELGVVYPAGLPHKARVSRPCLRVFLYAVLTGLLALLIARLLDLVS